MELMNFVGPTFALKVPTTWVIMASGTYQAMFISPPLENETSVNMSIVMDSGSVADSVEAYATRKLNEQSDNYQTFEALASGEVFESDNGVSGVQQRFHWQDDRVENTIHQMQTILHHQDVYYIITATRSDELPEDIAQRLDAMFQQMLMAWRWVEPGQLDWLL